MITDPNTNERATTLYGSKTQLASVRLLRVSAKVEPEDDRPVTVDSDGFLVTDSNGDLIRSN